LCSTDAVTLIPDIAEFKSLRTSLEGFTLNANN
jgi:hypothetical protein